MQTNNLLNYLLNGIGPRASYHAHKSEYYNLNNEINSLLKLYQVLSIGESITEAEQLQIPFLPNGIKLGSSPDDLIKKNGKPRFRINKNIGENHLVLFYRNQINSINIVSQFHYYYDVLVYVRLTFDYIELGKDASLVVYKSLEAKYDLSIKRNEDKYYKDINKNWMRIFDNGQLNIQYYYINDEIHSSIRKKIQPSTKPKSIGESDLIELI